MCSAVCMMIVIKSSGKLNFLPFYHGSGAITKKKWRSFPTTQPSPSIHCWPPRWPRPPCISPPLRPWPTQSSGDCSFPNIGTKWRNTLHNGLRTQLPYWLTMPPSWWKLDQHTHIYPIRTLLPHHPSHWAQQFLGLKQISPASSPTTYKAASSINYKPSNNDNNYSRPLGKIFMIMLVEHFKLAVHAVQVACATFARSTSTTCDLR
jgi:hypothetical protein